MVGEGECLHYIELSLKMSASLPIRVLTGSLREHSMSANMVGAPRIKRVDARTSVVPAPALFLEEVMPPTD